MLRWTKNSKLTLEQKQCLCSLKRYCNEKKLNVGLTDLFADIFFESNQLNQDRIHEITKFFKPTATFFNANEYDLQKYNNYPKTCGELVIKLRKFLENHNGKENGLFEFVLIVLSYLRFISKSLREHYPTDIKKPHPGYYYSEHSTSFSNSPRYGKIYRKMKAKCSKVRSYEERFNFPGLELRTHNSVEKSVDGIWILHTKVKFNSPNEIKLTKLEFWDEGGWGKLSPSKRRTTQIPEKMKVGDKFYPTTGEIYHTHHRDISQITKLLSILFNICIAPMRGSSDAAKMEKIREISLFEWIFQQASPFLRGTPTNTKILISAILLKHGFTPNHPCQDNDKNCFYSFMLTPSEYLSSWIRHTPYVNKRFIFSHLVPARSIYNLKHIPQSSMKEIVLNYKKICWCFKELNREMQKNKALFASKYFPFFNSNGQFKINNDLTDAHKKLDRIIFLQNKLLQLLQEQLPNLGHSQLKHIKWHINELIHKKPHALRLKRREPQSTRNKKGLNQSFHKYYCFGDTKVLTKINDLLDKELRIKNRATHS